MLVNIQCGDDHILFLDDKGIVYSYGNNKYGQCGMEINNSNDENYLNFITQINLFNIKDIKCGADSSYCIDKYGQLYAFGSNEYGQCADSRARYKILNNKSN